MRFSVQSALLEILQGHCVLKGFCTMVKVWTKVTAIGQGSVSPFNLQYICISLRQLSEAAASRKLLPLFGTWHLCSRRYTILLLLTVALLW